MSFRGSNSIVQPTSTNRLRNPSMSGGYSQQGYQARPPTSWAPPGPPMQQSGYGYMQPGAYPGQTPQYNTSQPTYPGYPPQPASGGYAATGWDQTTGTPNQQQTSQGGGYDYYGQQTQQQQQAPGGGSSAPADNTGYGYGQPPVSGYNSQGQGYSQDGYGGYPQPGYAHPQPNPMQGYDQQQGGYPSTPGYGNVANPTVEGHANSYGGGGAHGDAAQAPPPIQSSSVGQQGYTATQQPSPASYPQGTTQPGYGVPPTSQPGYGAQPPSGYGPNYAPPPQAQKPPANQSAYGQPQQSPGATQAGGYVQPSYAQAGYAQPDSSAQRAPASTYGTATAQPGYGALPYGAPPVTQPGYGQQPPPPYNSSYGGTYDAAPTSQAVQPSGVAKASPKS
ncbi:hypothetical protein U1Q18_049217 [Sarracenia purpurea var. burkii]